MTEINSIRLSGWILFIAIALILATIQIYACHRFISMRSLFIIQKRFPTIILVESIVVITFLLIVFPFWVNTGIIAVDLGDLMMDVVSIPYLSGTFFIFLISLLEFSRLWLMSYNLHHLNASKNEMWKSQIDTNIINKNWYIRNKKRYGSQRNVLIVALIYCVLVTVVVDISYVIDWNIGTLANLFCFSTIVTAIFVIFYQIRSYNYLQDNLLFFYELKITVGIWAIGVCIFVIAELVRFIFSKSKAVWLIANIINTIGALCALCGPSLLSTLWIPHKFTKSDRRDTIKLVSKVVSNSKLSTTCVIDENESPDKQAIFEILKNEQEFETFVQWMYRDFSSEAILAYIEMVQFKECSVKELQWKSAVDCVYMGSLYPNVPKSSIVYGDDGVDSNGMERMKRVATRLCDKYVKVGSKYEVNISYRLRNKIVSSSDTGWKVDTGEFILIFDAILDELFWFMRQSFERFRLDT